jgi:tRNA splicing ligase
MLGDDFNNIPVSEREKLVFSIMNDENQQHKLFDNDVNYDDIMNLSEAKKSSNTTPPSDQKEEVVRPKANLKETLNLSS